MCKKGILFILYLFFGLNGWAEESRIQFSEPEPYLDEEFKELTDTYIKDKIFYLRDFQGVLPMEIKNSKDLLFMNKIKADIKAEIFEDLEQTIRSMIRRELKIKHSSEQFNPVETSNIIHSSFTTRSELIEKMIREEEKNIRKKDYTPTYLNQKILNNRIDFVSINSNSNIIDIKNNSMIPLQIRVSNQSSIKFLDASIFFRNAVNQATYLLRRFSKKPIRYTNNVIHYYLSNQIANVPKGKYKVYILVRFLDYKGKLVSQDTMYWGGRNIDQNQYLILKN